MGQLRDGSFDRERHDLIFGRQKGWEARIVVACPRALAVVRKKSVGSAKVIRSYS